MPTLMLALSGPMQSWGSESRFTRRATEQMPTKSGVIGMLAAAQGRRRTDPVEDLVAIRFGVRADQPGTVLTDFQTAIDWRTGKSLPLSSRQYLADAKFLVGLEAERSLLEGLAEHLGSPRFPLYLGRRSCPPAERLVRGIRDEPLSQALEAESWLASTRHRTSLPPRVPLAVSRDWNESDGEASSARRRDVPRSFNPERRDYGWRRVVHEWIEMDNPDGRRDDPESHDVFEVVPGGS